MIATAATTATQMIDVVTTVTISCSEAEYSTSMNQWIHHELKNSKVKMQYP